MEHIVEMIRQRIPDFTERAMTFDDFLGACGLDGVGVEVREYHLDEQLRREPTPRIVLNARLAPAYRVFVAFHALAHWLGHPGRQEFYLGSPGWLDTVELEASNIGLLALSAHKGPPYPRLAKAVIRAEQLELWVDYPRVVLDTEPGGRPKRRYDWRRRRTYLTRVEQLSLELRQEPGQQRFRFDRRREP